MAIGSYPTRPYQSSLIGRQIRGRNTQKSSSNMRIGNIKTPSIGRIAKAAAPIAGLMALPSLANLSTAFMFEGTSGIGGMLSRGLAVPGALNKNTSPFANTSIGASVRNMSGLSKQSLGYSIKNNNISKPGMIMNYNKNNLSNKQMYNIAMRGMKL